MSEKPPTGQVISIAGYLGPHRRVFDNFAECDRANAEYQRSTTIRGCWFTHWEHGFFPVERAVLGDCDLSVLYVDGEWQWLVRRGA